MDVRVAKCLLLTKVLAADGMITENERLFLLKAMDRMGLAPDERERVLAFRGWDQAETALAHLSEGEKRELIAELVAAGGVDGKLSTLEAEMLARISRGLGLPT